ncbi:MAG: CHASE2 domain-containing protein [Cyclobacteriaceae bacterium]
MKKFILDTVLCSFFIFGIIGLFASITLFKVFDVFDPIGEMFSDFELTDIVFSKLREDPIADENIVVVNIGYLNREGLARQIEILRQYKPAVIGVDVRLDEPKTWEEDSALVRVLSQTPNVIMGEKLVNLNEKTNEFDSTLKPLPHLAQNMGLGYVNLITDAKTQDDLKMCREFTPSQMVKGKVKYAFPVRLALAMDSVKTNNFLSRGKEVEIINYKGNVMSFTSSKYGMKYFALDVNDVLEENFTPDIIEGKVVIMCFMGQYLGDVLTRDDFYFTPLNERYVGKAEHDMFGGVVHANIISQILDEDHIDSMSDRSALFLAILLCFVNVFVFKMVYGALPKWYDGITKLLQLAEVFFLATLMIYLFYSFNYKADFTLAMIVIALSGDSIEVYHGVIKNLFNKEQRRSIFKINRTFLK